MKLPIIKSKDKEKGQSEVVKRPDTTRSDSLFAVMRRMQGELKSLQSDVQILRRDVNRIDRKQYRDAEVPEVVKSVPREKRFFPGTTIEITGVN